MCIYNIFENIYILKICLIFLTEDHNEKRILSFNLERFQVRPY